MLLFLAVLQVFIQLADIISTVQILKRGGSELNPFIRSLGNKWKIVKIVVGIGTAGAMYLLRSIPGLVIVDGIALSVVLWNVYQLFKMRGFGTPGSTIS